MILSLDASTKSTGYAIFDEDKLISYGKWSSNGTHSTERISQTKNWIACMIEKWKPDLVVLEDIQLQKFGEDGQEGVLTFKKLAALQGVLKNYCFESGIIYKIVSPSTWRAHSEIKGKSRTDKKKNAQLKVKRLYDISVTQDEADAVLIGAWAVNDRQNSKMISFI